MALHLPLRKCTHFCAFRGSPLSSSHPSGLDWHKWEREKGYLYLLFTTTFASCPFHENWGTRGVRQSDEGSLWARRLALLSSDDACSRSQNQRYTTCQLWQASCEARDMLCQQTQSALAGWAVLHSHVNHCLQLIRTSERWICSDVVKECLLYKQLWTRFAVYTLDKILVRPLICNNWLTLTLIIQ